MTETSRHRARLLRLLLIATALVTLLVQSGQLGTSDATQRMQVAHSWWTGEPEVPAGDYPELGMPGRGGRLHAWYGIGQSLLFLPFDIVGAGVEKLPIFAGYGDDPTVRSIVVSVSVSLFLNLLTALVGFRFLLLMEFSETQAALGVLALICATTHLHYTQNLQENNYIFLLTLTGLFFHARWALGYGVPATRASRRMLVFGAVPLGLNLLTRVTTGLDALCAGLMAAMILWQSGRAGGMAELWRACKSYLSVTAPIYVIFLFLDRLYQFIRFGSWTSTYSDLYGRHERQYDPTLPATFPFSGHWFQGGLDSGILGPLFSPRKSILLFDPLFDLAIILLILLWPRMSPLIRSYFVAMLLLVGASIVLYAKYFSWAGEFSWGDRYVATAVELVSLLAVPLLVKYWRSLAPALQWMGACTVALGLLLQAISVAFWFPLEIYQIDDFDRQACVPCMRASNVAAQFVAQCTGARPAWSIPIPGIDDTWDLTHIATWNLLPSMLRHVGAAPMWVVYLLEGVWAAALAALALVLWKLARELRLRSSAL